MNNTIRNKLGYIIYEECGVGVYYIYTYDNYLADFNYSSHSHSGRKLTACAAAIISNIKPP